MMIGSEDSRSPLGRPSSLVPPMTLQPLHSMCSGAVSPPQCFPAGVPTGDIPADLWAALLHNAAVPCWRLFDSGTHGHVASATHAPRSPLGLPARHGRALPPAKFNCTMSTIEDFVYNLSVLRVQQAKGRRVELEEDAFVAARTMLPNEKIVDCRPAQCGQHAGPHACDK